MYICVCVCVYRVLVVKPEGKRQVRRPRCRWEDNIKMDLQEVGCGDIDCLSESVIWERWRAFLNAVMNIWVP